MKFQYHGFTHPGIKKNRNEDTILIFIPHNYSLFQNKGAFFGIADGVGGLELGDIASQTALNLIRDNYYLCNQKNLSCLQEAFFKAHEEISKKAREKNTLMGTTATVLIIKNSSFLVGHVGNSRLYFLSYRKNHFSCLTSDHTLVAELIEQGVLNKEQARNHPRRHIITQALGVKITKIFLERFSFLDKGCFFLCTDGIYEYLSDNEIKEILKKQISPQEKSKLLTTLALKRKVKDDFSGIIIEIS